MQSNRPSSRNASSVALAPPLNAWLGAAVQLGVGKILASDALSKSGGQGHAYRNTWAGAYDYQISKRTDVYTAVGNGEYAGFRSSSLFALMPPLPLAPQRR